MKNLFTQVVIEYNNVLIRSNIADIGVILERIMSGESDSVGKEALRILGDLGNIYIRCCKNKNLKRKLEA